MSNIFLNYNRCKFLTFIKKKYSEHAQPACFEAGVYIYVIFLMFYSVFYYLSSSFRTSNAC